MTRPGRPSITTAALVVGTIIAQQVAAKATRDAFFLEHFGARGLAQVMTLTAALALGGAWTLSRLLVRSSPARVARRLFVLNSALFALEWWLSASAPRVAAALTYVHTGVIGGVSVSAFWSVINEGLDPHTAKRSMGRLGTGASAGGVVGGLFASLVSWASDVTVTLGALAVANVLCALLVRLVPSGRRFRVADSERLGFAEAFGNTPYLWRLAGLLALVELSDALIEYAFKARAGETFGDGGELATFFGVFHAVAAVLTLGFQALATQPILERHGLSRAAAGLPAISVVGGVASLVVPVLAPTAVLRAVTSAMQNSLFRSAYELGYTPLAPEKKRPTKTLIDVGAGKLSATIGGAITLLLVGLTSTRTTLAITMVLVVSSAALSVVVAWALDRGYRRALADALRSGRLELDPGELVDASTRDTYAASMSLDRAALLEQIEAWRAREALASEPHDSHADDDPLLLAAASLASSNPRRIRGVFAEYAILPRELVRPTIMLLGFDAVLSDALVALRAVVDEHADVLCDALVDPTTPLSVRRRLPRVLRSARTQQVVDALTRALEDPSFEVRYRSGIALLRIVVKHPELSVDKDSVLHAVRRETDSSRASRDIEGLLDPSEGADASPFAEGLGGRAARHGVTHAFTLLALVYDPEPLLLAYAALASDDERLRGTALEYVDIVLPEDLRDSLWKYLTDSPRDARTRRSRADLVNQLRRSTDSLAIDRDALRELLGGRRDEPPN